MILATNDITNFDSEKLYKAFTLFIRYNDILNINLKKLINNEITYADF